MHAHECVYTRALQGPGAAAYRRFVLWSNSPAGTACSWLWCNKIILQAEASGGAKRGYGTQYLPNV